VHVTTVPETLLFLRGQAGYLGARGVEVHAISSPGPELAQVAAEGVRCLALPMQREIAPLADLASLARLWRALRRLRPDVVDAHTPKAGLLATIAARLAGVPVRVYHLHGLRYVTTRGAKRALLRATERVACALSTRVLSVSHTNARILADEGLAAPGKVRVLLGGSINGVDPARFRPPGAEACRAARAALGIPPDARVVGYVGRLVREKGVAELAEAWRAVRDEHPDLRLLLVGPAEPHDPLPPGVLDGLRADPRVRLHGLDRDTPRLYAAMDLVALPSWREGFPVVPLEAAAMGLPVVATAVPGCTDAVVPGVTGALVPPRDAAALAAALRAYVQDVALRERHGAAARARAVAEFDPARLWEALHAEYVDLLAERGARGGTGRSGAWTS
jgi:glycosyltransferase involved in cell wall biosynthesis